MKMKLFGRMMLAAMLTTSAVAPALALDYEAKPIHWLLLAPIRTAGAVSGAVVSGAVSGPTDAVWHHGAKGTKKLAGKMGDENGMGQQLVALPAGGSAGLVMGAPVGVCHGVKHGWKTGWEHPFSRWSYITMEEK